MALVVPAVLVGVALMVMAVMSQVTARRQRLAAARSRVHLPLILVHDINDDRCTGCDACVAVCPTNVLDLIGNKSRVVRFQDCIQCEQCVWACPTEALVMHREGTEPPPLTMPELDGAYQTAVPGMYLIGEVAGKPLVKNAANLGRGVVEHMLAGGLRAGARPRGAEGSDSASITEVDVLIVGSGPGGLSAALTCMQRGLRYLVLDKEQIVCSTVARYPRGKLVMAEPYDCRNLSLLPVFDSSKEQLLPIWEELMVRTGLRVRLGEAVEKIERMSDSWFDVRTTVARYRAQRVVLATGLRGKPRTLGVPGENLRKVVSLLEDPAEHRGRSVLVVGGGDSALEAAMALADAGAQVLLSYRGRAFNRAQQKNKQAIAAYTAQRKVKVKLQSQVVEITAAGVTLRLADGARKRYPNEAAFVLIGADPPVTWLESLGVGFVKRPHAYQLGPTDAFVAQFLGAAAVECPRDAVGAAALVTGVAQDREEATRGRTPMPKILQSGRQWIRSATAVFTSARRGGRAAPNRALAGPMPLSEFARQTRAQGGAGRRDALPPRERTRVLRMLRDDGARLADEESQVYALASPPVEIVAPPPTPRAMAAAAAAPAARADTGPRSVLIVGLAKAQGDSRRRRRTPLPRSPRCPPRCQDAATVHTEPREEATVAVDLAARALMAQAERARQPRRLTPATLPPSVHEEVTRAVDLGALPDIHEQATRAIHVGPLGDLDWDLD
jgi:thioredoxin reductase/NAD-dependent dihydropyrimidine dehydrogenase PreA subunit